MPNDLTETMILESEKSNLKVILDRFMKDSRRHWNKSGISESAMLIWATEWLKEREISVLKAEAEAQAAREAQSYQSSEQMGFSFA